jgi:hypothetical protein
MTLKSELVIAPDWVGKRDAGKAFLITEMYAYDAEKWARNVWLAMKGTAGFVPDDVSELGMVGIAVRTINAFLAADIDPARFDPLMDQMMTCVQIVRDPRNHPEVAMPLPHPPPSPTPFPDLEEVATVGWLRSEVIRIHTGFSFADSLSALLSLLQKFKPQTTQTSPTPSA